MYASKSLKFLCVCVLCSDIILLVSSVNISPHEEVKFTTEPFTEFDKLNSADESSVTEFDGLNTLDTSQQVKNSYTEIEHESTLGQNVKTFDWLESAAVYTASVDLTESLPTSAVSYDRNDSSVNESSTPSRGIADFSSRIKPVSGTDSNMDRTSINLPRTEISKIIIGTNVIKSCRLRPQLNASETQLCEASNVINAETLTVLLDKETNLTYQNIFCAKCNNVTAKLTPAKLKVKCRSAMFIYKATHLDSLLKMALESGSNCIVTQTWSEENVTLCMPTKYCSQLDNLKPGDSVCREKANIGGYANHVSNGFGSLTSFLLNFDPESYMLPQESGQRVVYKHANCSADEWSTPDGRCLPMQCSPGKLLINSSCTSALEISELEYRLRLWLTFVKTPSTPVIAQYYPCHYLVQSANQKFQLWFDKFLATYIITTEVFDVAYGYQDTLKTDSFPCLIRVDARLKGPANVSRDEFESLVLDSWMNGQITLEEGRKLNLTFQPSDATSKRKDAFVSCDEMRKTRSDVYCEGYTECTEGYFSVINEGQLITINNILTCGHVTFNTSEYELNVLDNASPPDFTVTLDLNVTKVTLSEAQDLNYLLIEESGELKVCWEILEKKLKEIQDADKSVKEKSDVALYAVSLACSVVSLVCLVLTIMTYLIHPILRTFAGKNNMMLSLSLLLAQTSLLAAVHIEYTGNVCTFLGMSTHFLWLWMFSWTFICSLDMFLVFTAKTRSSCCQDDYKSFIKRCLVSVSLPATVVSVVVAVTYNQTSGQGIGYGSMRCFLDSLLLTGVALGGPLLVIVLCNTAFFVTTVVKIHKVRQLKTSDLKKEEQSNLIVYVKLSAMTGIFWLLTTIAHVSQNSYFQFIVEPINGLQGVYIFMSYICNRRVLSLYFRKEEVKATKTNSMSLTSRDIEKQK
ncbi:adhesion G protein-coupled receptor E3 [Biomphalaria glabrata]|nr:adhesion G protein-coupled receptor E3 [Biomphalaria glabrata]